MARVIDPEGGSWVVESLTDAGARQAGRSSRRSRRRAGRLRRCTPLRGGEGRQIRAQRERGSRHPGCDTGQASSDRTRRPSSGIRCITSHRRPAGLPSAGRYEPTRRYDASSPRRRPAAALRQPCGRSPYTARTGAPATCARGGIDAVDAGPETEEGGNADPVRGRRPRSPTPLRESGAATVAACAAGAPQSRWRARRRPRFDGKRTRAATLAVSIPWAVTQEGATHE